MLRCRRTLLRRCVALLAAHVLRDRTAFGNHLVETAIETRQRVGDAIRCPQVGRRDRRGSQRRSRHQRRRRAVEERRSRRRLRVSLVLRLRRRGVVLRRRRVLRLRLRRMLRLSLRRRRGLTEASLRHALELSRQVIETIMHRREAIIDVLVVDMVTV